MNKLIKFCLMLGLWMFSLVFAHATETIESLTGNVTAVATTANTTYLALAAISVGAFVIGTIVYFTRKGASLRK